MKNIFGSTMGGLLAASALALTVTPAFAGDEERALAAIALAQGKLDAASRINASPELIARAQASLRLAKEQYQSGKEQKAIASALDAQQAADTAIGESKQSADMSAQVQTEATLSAQQQADAANARAAAAEQAAASAAADAAAARNAAAVAAARPATTTVTTETVKTAAATPRRTTAPRKIVRKTTTTAPRTAVAEQTTTTVTTQN